MLNLNVTVLGQVVDQALIDAAAHPRWVVAIGRAVLELNTNPWIERGDLHGLIIGSPSGKCYTSNGECQCTAFEFGQPCWHRAAARLVRLHDEAIDVDRENTYRYGAQVMADARSARLAAARAAADVLNECYG